MNATSHPYQSLKKELALYHQTKEPSLAEFIREAWPIVEPGQVLEWNWHIDAICQHLEAVSDGRIKRLIINIPPRHMKSLIVSVFWPAWSWIKKPELRWLVASNTDDLAIGFSVQCRDIITSDWFQSRWGHKFKLAGDQNVKGKYRNSRKGVRQALSITGKCTGKGANIVLIDDPHDVKDADSDAKIEQAKRGYKALSTRLNDPKKGAIVIIAQRVSEADLCGELLKNKAWDHLCFPSEYEETDRVTSIGWKDPRTVEGALLWPSRFDSAYLENLRLNDLGDYGYAAQHQQRPSPAGGGLFKVEKLKANLIDLSQVPTGCKKVRTWDFAATVPAPGKDPDYTVGLNLHKKERKYYIVDVERERKSPGEIQTLVKGTAEKDGHETLISIEEEKGSAGKHLCEHYRDEVLPGYIFIPLPPTGDKVTRARPAAVQVEAGNVYVVRAPWNNEFFKELGNFPYSKHKDQADAFSAAFRLINMDEAAANFVQTFKLSKDFKSIVDGPKIENLSVFGYFEPDFTGIGAGTITRVWVSDNGLYYLAEAIAKPGTPESLLASLAEMESRQRFEAVGIEEAVYDAIKRKIEEVEDRLPYLQIVERVADRVARQRNALVSLLNNKKLLIRSAIAKGELLVQITNIGHTPDYFADGIAGAIELAQSYQ